MIPDVNSNTPRRRPVTDGMRRILRVQAALFLIAAAATTVRAQSNPLPQAATPAFSVAGGTYASGLRITIADATPNATIYYTVTGKVIAAPASVYTGPIPVSATETINATAVASGYARSAAASATYTIEPPAATPVFSVGSGAYTSIQSVSIADTTPGASIYYTITGTTPGQPSTLYTGPVSVSANETINAIAIAPGNSQSAPASASYIILLPASTPAFSLHSGIYASAQTLAIADTTPGATIYYTTNGAAPTTASAIYSAPVPIPAARSIQAFAVAPGHTPSSVATGTFSIVAPVGIVTPSSLPQAYVGAPFAATVQASGGASSFSWSVNGTAIPPTGQPTPISGGLTAVSNGNPVLAIAGKPLTTGAVSLSLAVTDNYTGSQAGPVVVTVPVAEPLQPSLPAPTPSTLGPTLTHENYSGYLAVGGGVAPYTWTVTGLPSTMNVAFSTPISTIAGNGAAGYSGDGGAATAAQIQDAGGVAVDSAGNVYFADPASARVRIVTPAGIISTAAGTGVAGYNGDNIAATSAKLNNPIGIAVDRAGNLYIADSGNGRIRMVNASTGIITTIAGGGAAGFSGDGLIATTAQLNRPTGVAVDCLGNLFIADSGNARVRQISAASGIITTFAGSSSAGYSGDGGPASQARLKTPYAVAVDRQGDVYIADLTAFPGATPVGGHIRVVSAQSGFIATVAGNGAAGYNGDGIAATQAALANPIALAVDAGGTLYIADAGNQRVRAVTPSGIIATLAGNGVFGSSSDALPAAVASLESPAGLGVDSQGDVFIADQSARIRMVQTPSGQSNLLVQGTPPVAGNIALQVAVQDAAGSIAGPVTYSIAVANPLPLSLPVPNPSTLPAAVLQQPYSGSIIASGGVPPFQWTVRGGPVPSTGVPGSMGSGFLASTTGSDVLSFGGAPVSTATESIWVTVRDGMGHTAGPVTYSVDVMNAPGATVSGQVTMVNCGLPASGVSLTLNTTPAQVVSTDANGNFSFANVPSGTFTITPSSSAPSAAFSPAAQTVTVTGSAVGGVSFQAAIGYNVSGGVGYTNGIGGRIYLSLTSTGCPSATFGTSIAGPQNFTIHGVPPGTYTLTAWVDELGYGAFNDQDPMVTQSNIIVGFAGLASLSVSFTQPQPPPLAAPPSIAFAGGYSGGAIVSYTPVVDSNGVEQAGSYAVQWSATPAFTTIAGTRTFNATGANGVRAWFLNGLPSRTTYYFRVMAANAISVTPWSSPFGPVTIGIPATGNTVSGTLSFPSSFKGALYVGFRDLKTGMTYAQIILGAVSPQAYSIKVPTGSNYAMFALIDQNGDAMADNTDSNGLNSVTPIAIAGATTLNFALPASDTVSVATQHLRSITPNGEADSYALQLNVPTTNLTPLGMELTSGPHVAAPADAGYCLACGNQPFNYWASLGSTAPQPGNSYQFAILNPSGIVAAGWGTGTTVTANAAVTAVVNDFAANLSPASVTGAGTTPSFSWTGPADASNYVYQFTLWDANGKVIWQVPGLNSPTQGFSSTITSIAWGVDPTGANNPPSLPSLTPGETYTWSVQLLDANGNSSEMPVSFNP